MRWIKGEGEEEGEDVGRCLYKGKDLFYQFLFLYIASLPLIGM